MRHILSPAIGFPRGAPASVDHATLHLELAGNIGAYGASAPNHWPNEIWAISSLGISSGRKAAPEMFPDGPRRIARYFRKSPAFAYSSIATTNVVEHGPIALMASTAPY